jgi:hypothetical protein
MEKLPLEDLINILAEAYANHDNATKDRDEVVGGAFDSYYGEIFEPMSKRQLKELKAERKAEMKNIKKVAKAMSAGKKDEVEGEADSMQEILSAIKQQIRPGARTPGWITTETTQGE